MPGTRCVIVSEFSPAEATRPWSPQLRPQKASPPRASGTGRRAAARRGLPSDPMRPACPDNGWPGCPRNRDDARVGEAEPAWSDETRQASWIGKRLAPFGAYVVTSVVPGGFEAYAQVLHPAEEPLHGGGVVRWAEVAAWSGLPLRPGTTLTPARPTDERGQLRLSARGRNQDRNCTDRADVRSCCSGLVRRLWLGADTLTPPARRRGGCDGVSIPVQCTYRLIRGSDR